MGWCTVCYRPQRPRQRTGLSQMSDLPIKVIPSEEVKTSEGEIIGYFLSELAAERPQSRRNRQADQGAGWPGLRSTPLRYPAHK